MFQAYFLLEHEVVVRFGIKICVFTIVWDKEGVLATELPSNGNSPVYLYPAIPEFH